VTLSVTAPVVPFVRPGRGPDLMVRRSRLALLVQTAYLQNLCAEHLEPGQQPVQGRLIANLTVHHGLHRFDRGDQVLEVEQGFGRQDANDADLVRGGCHPGPQSIGNGGARASP